MIPHGPEAPEAECDTPEVRKDIEARQRLADYRAQIEEDAASGRLSFLSAESCRAVADAIEDLYDSLDQALSRPEEDAASAAEDHDGAGAGDSGRLEVEGDEVESSEAVRTPSEDSAGGTSGYAIWVPPPPHRYRS